MPCDSHEADDQKEKMSWRIWVNQIKVNTDINIWMGPCYPFYEFSLVLNSVDVSAVWISNTQCWCIWSACMLAQIICKVYCERNKNSTDLFLLEEKEIVKEILDNCCPDYLSLLWNVVQPILVLVCADVVMVVRDPISNTTGPSLAWEHDVRN